MYLNIMDIKPIRVCGYAVLFTKTKPQACKCTGKKELAFAFPPTAKPTEKKWME